MEPSFRPFRTGSDADLAFAVVVLASYFSTFSVMHSAEPWRLLVMISLGVAYIAAGIYGYAYVAGAGRRALLAAYFVLQFVTGAAIVLLARGLGYSALVLLPLAGQSVMLLPEAWRMLVNLAMIAIFALTTRAASGSWQAAWAGLPLFLAGQIFIVVFTQMAVSEEKARRAVEGLVIELEQANHQLRQNAMQAEELATTRERNRLAREIHDGLGHYLTTIFMQLQAARAVMDSHPTRAADALRTAQNMTQEALTDVRRSVSALRDQPRLLESLPDELERLLQTCDRTNLHAQLKVLGSQRTLSPQLALTIYRAVQEGINNSCKHARASHLSVTLDYTQASALRLSIVDDGVGAETTTGGFGLMGMRERVHLLNGSFDIITQPQQGFRLEICIPG